MVKAVTLCSFKMGVISFHTVVLNLQENIHSTA